MDRPGTGVWELTATAPGLRAAAVSKADVAAVMLGLAKDPAPAGRDQWHRRSPLLVAAPR